MKKIKPASSLLAMALASLLVGCVGPATPPLYYWGSYETQVYNHFKGMSPTEQITALEQDLQKARAQNARVAPGMQAHLGLLYAETGNSDQALAYLLAEKTQYPESAAYIDLLLKKYAKK